jgi:hypothetical protein
MLEPNRWAWRPQAGPQKALVVMENDGIHRTTSRRSKQQRFKARIKSPLWRAKKKLGKRIVSRSTVAKRLPPEEYTPIPGGGQSSRSL